MIEFDVLKQALFQEIADKKYKGGLLIDIFLKDSAYVKQMVKEGKCLQDAFKFLENNVQKLTDIYNQVSIPFFRNIKYEELLQEYCEKKTRTETKVDKPSKQKKIKKFSGEIALDTKDWLLKNWGTDTHVIVDYLINESKAEKIVWVESKSGNAFTIVLDDSHVIKLKRSIKKKDISFWLVRKNDGKNQNRAISKEEYDKLYAVIKHIEYVEKVKVPQENDVTKTIAPVIPVEDKAKSDKILTTNLVRQTDDYTKGWLLVNWTTSPRLFINYLIDETRTGNVVWAENLSSNSFNVVWNENRTILVEGFINNYYLTRRKKGKKKKRDSITKNDFDRLYAAIKNEKYVEDENFKSSEQINPYVKNYVIENLDSFVQFVVNETKVGNVEWNEFMDGKTFTAKIGNNVITLIRSKKKRKFTYQITAESVDGYKRTRNFGDTDPYGLYEIIQETKRRKQFNTIKELNRYSQLIASVYKVNMDADLEELYKLTIRLQRDDEKCGGIIDATYSGKVIWNRVIQSGVTGSIYITNIEEDKYLLRCYKENGNFLYRLYKNAEHIPNSGITRYLEVMIKSRNPKTVSNVDLSAYYPIKETKPVEKKVIVEPNLPSANRKIAIGIKDLVVRRNVFKCMHKKHTIEDVDAVVKIMNKNIEVEEVVVSAGYCRQCKVFFILESTYQQLLRKGIVACRTVDEKSYLSQTYLNGKLLAQESILMQFGYTVSQTEGLSEERRHKILSVLVDNHILTKSEIISYLDFFISQRKSDKFALAVAKWTIDRNYIRNYRVGEYSRIGVVFKNDI